eukprot:scaffold108589_cov19-Prasinocladus_malaysianus.AAC.1
MSVPDPEDSISFLNFDELANIMLGDSFALNFSLVQIAYANNCLHPKSVLMCAMHCICMIVAIAIAAALKYDTCQHMLVTLIVALGTIDNIAIVFTMQQ